MFTSQASRAAFTTRGRGQRGVAVPKPCSRANELTTKQTQTRRSENKLPATKTEEWGVSEETEVNIYILLHTNRSTRTHSAAQETLLDNLQYPMWEKSLGEKRYTYMDN